MNYHKHLGRTFLICLNLAILAGPYLGCSVYSHDKVASKKDSGAGGRPWSDASNRDANRRDDAASDASLRGCTHNRDGNEECPWICPEVCDGVDNDCDGETDEASEACALDHAWSVCDRDACAIQRCDALYDNCDGIVANGCETRLDSLTDCGTCGARCAETGCAGGACSKLTCPSGLADCNANSDDGCETALTTLIDCAMCGKACTIANAVATCTSGTCEFVRCKAGFADCDHDLYNGCEVALDTITNCGACGKVCTASNGTPTCAGGRCTTSICEVGFADCNGDVSDGCEASVRSLEHCGSCDENASCGPLDHATVTCATGACLIGTCETGYGNCDGESANGCETPLNTVQNCGGCRVACAATNGTA